MSLCGCNSQFYLQSMNILLCTPHLSSYIIEFEHFVILSSYLACMELWYKITKVKCSVYWITWKKTFMVKSFPLTEVFDIDFPCSLPYFLSCRLITLHVNIGKVDKDFPYVSTLFKWISTGSGWFIFHSRSLEILVAERIFDEICTVCSPVCLCFIASGFLFMNGKRLHHWSWESRVTLCMFEIFAWFFSACLVDAGTFLKVTSTKNDNFWECSI